MEGDKQMRKVQWGCFKGIFLLILFTISSAGFGWSATDRDAAQLASYFSQGQSAYDPQNRTKSREQALGDFLAQAIVQAIGTQMSPSQIGTQYGPIQEKILKNASQYVEKYQIFSEMPIDGLYQVRGQVPVVMETLKKDLAAMGLTQAAGPAKPPSTLPSDAAEPQPGSGEKQVRVETSRGTPSGAQKLFWAVAEKWGPKWYMPGGGRDPRGIFAASAVQDSQDFGWSVAVDESGNVQTSQVTARAGALGIQKAIVGNVVLRKRQGRSSVLEATLRILEVSSGQFQGEIHKELNLEEGADQEAAMELSSLVMPQIERLMGESTKQLTSGPKAEVSTTPSIEPIKGAGEWVLVIHSRRSYAYWEELEKLLRDHFKSMRIVRLVFDSDVAKVKLDGVDGQFIASLQGTALRDGTRLQIDGFAQDTHSLDISLVPSETRRPE
jgi:hypothetical protein